MTHRVTFVVCAVLGLGLLYGGLQVPAHLRAVDASVLQQAGAGTSSVTDEASALIRRNQFGAAQLLVPAIERTSQPAAAKVRYTVAEAINDPKSPAASFGQGKPFTEFVVRTDYRAHTFRMLQAASNPLVQGLMQFRSFTNTVLLPAATSAAGQATDIAIAVCGLLAETGHLSTDLNNTLLVMAANANRSGNSQPLEEALMDLMSLGQRLDWSQLNTLTEYIKDTNTLRTLSNFIRRGDDLPTIYAASCLTRNPGGVADYLTHFSETGLTDLRQSLAYGAGGMNTLIKRDQQLCAAASCNRFAGLWPGGKPPRWLSGFAFAQPTTALVVKWFLYLLGGFFFASAIHYVRQVPVLERPLQVRGIHFIRETLFALGFLLVVLLASEPFLAHGSQKETVSLRVRLPMVGTATPAGAPATTTATAVMNQTTFLTMLLFFVLQGLLYVACLVKLAEIRRQRVSARVKLKLLENEEHLFDAGLYLGFLGTIISLVFVSLGLVKTPSLMSAYSSTSFGIIFVVIFKVLHLRSARRTFLLEAEMEPPLRAEKPLETQLAAPL